MNDFGYPYVSICVPTYEQTEYLSKLMESIVIQNYKNYEVIISDDSNTDSVKKLIDTRYSSMLGGKLRYYRNEPALGSPSNWNEVISYANGNVIHLIHHDDYYADEFALANVVQKFQTYPSIDYILGKVYSYNAKNNELVDFNKYNINLRQKCLSRLFNNTIGPPSSLIFKRNIMPKFDPNLQWFVDTEFYYRVCKLRLVGFCSDAPFIVSVNNGNHNLTQTFQDNPQIELLEFFYIYKKHICSVSDYLYFISKFSVLVDKYGLYSIEDLSKIIKTQKVPLVLRLVLKIKRYVFILKSR